MAQDDRAAIDAMNGVLDQLFGKRKKVPTHAGGNNVKGPTPPADPSKALKSYIEELLLAGVHPNKVAEMLATSHLTAKGKANPATVNQLQSHVVRNLSPIQKSVNPQLRSFKKARDPSVANFVRIAALSGHTKDIEGVLNALNITDPQEREMYKNEAYSHRSKEAYPKFISHLQSQPDKETLDKTIKSLNSITTNSPKFDAIMGDGSRGHMAARPIRMLLKAREPGLEGLGLTQAQLRNYIMDKQVKQANLTKIKLPSNPIQATAGSAASFVRNQAMNQFSKIGQSLGRSNTPKSISRLNKPSSTALPNLNFIPQRGVSSAQSTQPSWFQRNRDRLIDATMLGGGSALLGLVGSLVGSIPMPFATGGELPKFNRGGNDWIDPSARFRASYAKSIMGKDVEHLGVFLPNALRGFTSIGNQSGVSLNEEQLKNARNSYSVHNHPYVNQNEFGSSNLSYQDIRLALYSGMRRTSAINQRGNFTSFTRPPGIDLSAIEELKKYDSHDISSQIGLHKFNPSNRDVISDRIIFENIQGVLDKVGIDPDLYQFGNIKDTKDWTKLATGGSIPQFNTGTPNAEQLKHLTSWVNNSKQHNINATSGVSDQVIETLDALKSPLRSSMMAHKGLSMTNPLNKGLRIGKTIDFSKIGRYQSMSPSLDDAMGYAHRNVLSTNLSRGTLATRIPNGLGIAPELVLPPLGKFKVDGRENIDDYKVWSMHQIPQHAIGNNVKPYAGNVDMGNLLAQMATLRSVKGVPNLDVLSYTAKHGGSNGVMDPETIKQLILPKHGLGDVVKQFIPNINIKTGKHAPLLNLNRLFGEGRSYYSDWASEKNTLNMTKGKDPRLTEKAQRIFNKTITKDLLNQYDPKVHGAPKFNVEQRNMTPYVDTFMRNMPDDWKKAMAVVSHNKPINFSGVPVNSKDADQKSLLGKFYPNLNKIYARLDNKRIQNTLQHEMAHAFYRGASPKARELAIKRLTNAGFKLDEKDYWKRPTEVLAKSVGHLGVYKSGGSLSSLGNPIRVSDGELAISRGMTQNIGLDVLRKLNSGDMSALSKGFNTGGVSEYHGPGTGTSDSILEDADKGVRGPSSDDIGFIIKRSSSDKIKSIMGGGFNKLKGVGRYASGGSIGSYAIGDQVRDAFNVQKGTKGINKELFAAVSKILDEVDPDIRLDDLMKRIFDDASVQKSGHNAAGTQQNATYLKNRELQLGDIFKSAGVSNDQTDASKAKQSEEDNVNARDKNTQLLKEENETIKKLTGVYRGEIAWADRQRKQGDRHATNMLGMDAERQRDPTYMPRGELTSQSGSRKELGWWGTHVSGFFDDFKKEMYNPTQNQVNLQGTLTKAIGGQYDPNNAGERDLLEANRRTFNTERATIRNAFVGEFGNILGNRNVRNLLQVEQSTKMETQKVLTGYDSEGKGQYETVDREVGTTIVKFGALAEALAKAGMSADEFHRRAEVLLQPTDASAQGITTPIYNNKTKKDDVSTILGGSTAHVERFNQEVGRTAHNNTLLYKMGDALRGISWRFASLGMSAMGVYFSIQGLMMVFQNGLNSIITPLSDVDSLMKSIGMSKAFGTGIFNAGTAMERLNVTTQDMIGGWKNLTNMTGTIQTFFASIGTKVFGDKNFTDDLLKGISEVFEVLGSDKSIETFKNLIEAVVDALPGIIPALENITWMLQVLADNKWLIEWGAQLLMISLILQPIMSGLAAVVTIGGGFATITNLAIAFGGGLSYAAVGATGLTASLVGLVAVVGVALVAWEALGRAINFVTGSNYATPTSILGNLMSGKPIIDQGFASGGTVQSEGYDMVPNNPDDTIVTVKAGETVRTPEQERDLQKKLKGNKLQGFNTGTPLMPSAATPSPADATYQFNTNKALADLNNRNTGLMAKNIDGAYNNGAFDVNVINMPAMWGNGNGSNNGGLPFDLGIPAIYQLLPTRGPISEDTRDKGSRDKNSDKARDKFSDDGEKDKGGKLIDRLRSIFDSFRDRGTRDKNKDGERDKTKDKSKDDGRERDRGMFDDVSKTIRDAVSKIFNKSTLDTTKTYTSQDIEKMSNKEISKLIDTKVVKRLGPSNNPYAEGRMEYELQHSRDSYKLLKKIDGSTGKTFINDSRDIADWVNDIIEAQKNINKARSESTKVKPPTENRSILDAFRTPQVSSIEDIAKLSRRQLDKYGYQRGSDGSIYEKIIIENGKLRNKDATYNQVDINKVFEDIKSQQSSGRNKGGSSINAKNLKKLWSGDFQGSQGWGLKHGVMPNYYDFAVTLGDVAKYGPEQAPYTMASMIAGTTGMAGAIGGTGYAGTKLMQRSGRYVVDRAALKSAEGYVIKSTPITLAAKEGTANAAKFTTGKLMVGGAARASMGAKLVAEMTLPLSELQAAINGIKFNAERRQTGKYDWDYFKKADERSSLPESFLTGGNLGIAFPGRYVRGGLEDYTQANIGAPHADNISVDDLSKIMMQNKLDKENSQFQELMRVGDTQLLSTLMPTKGLKNVVDNLATLRADSFQTITESVVGLGQTIGDVVDWIKNYDFKNAPKDVSGAINDDNFKIELANSLTWGGFNAIMGGNTTPSTNPMDVPNESWSAVGKVNGSANSLDGSFTSLNFKVKDTKTTFGEFISEMDNGTAQMYGAFAGVGQLTHPNLAANANVSVGDQFAWVGKQSEVADTLTNAMKLASEATQQYAEQVNKPSIINTREQTQYGDVMRASYSNDVMTPDMAGENIHNAGKANQHYNWFVDGNGAYRVDENGKVIRKGQDENSFMNSARGITETVKSPATSSNEASAQQQPQTMTVNIEPTTLRVELNARDFVDKGYVDIQIDGVKKEVPVIMSQYKSRIVGH